ncbi:MAG: hypothetical protein MUF06_02990 [Pirellulaceae bacterium]|jgi:hypothetical protein|nr:hypothetical protein [Pirellulaceae bacterium]
MKLVQPLIAHALVHMTEASADSTSVRSTLAGKLVAVAGVVVSCLYLSNIGAGFFEFSPDVIPGIGNLDEVFFSGVLIASLHKLGISVLPGLGQNRNRHQPPAAPADRL